MKHVINGGISTANVPSYSRDAVLLALHTNYLDGVSLNLFQTKDKKIVAYPTSTVDNGKENISDLTLYNLERRNFGERVRRHSILELSDALGLFDQGSKTVVLNVEDETDDDYKKELVRLTNLYPNVDIYIKSSNPDMLNYLNTSCQKERVGAVITEKNQDLWTDNFDFFSICMEKIDYEEIRAKVKAHKRVMIENVNTEEKYQEVKNNTRDISDSIYIIIDDSKELTSIALANYNNNSL